MSDRSESMWYCPTCEAWVGWKLDECPECGRSQPWRPVRSADVDGPAWTVTRWDRVKAKLGLVGEGDE
ncbi:hypothetical protein [Halobacterium sp. KA-6]|uniref:hypothetical protein n=1 Tax=Halobacterium sp. KA-6 TaxID=2896368 RepID=UPI001E3358B1|nr:hypothetical protein [Halobacterium sp. KA-6]MCD2205309.1 hypothetical protein [Halobacterium sp. KA-6]